MQNMNKMIIFTPELRAFVILYNKIIKENKVKNRKWFPSLSSPYSNYRIYKIHKICIKSFITNIKSKLKNKNISPSKS